MNPGNVFCENVRFFIKTFFAKPIIMLIGDEIVSDIGNENELFFETNTDTKAQRYKGTQSFSVYQV